MKWVVTSKYMDLSVLPGYGNELHLSHFKMNAGRTDEFGYVLDRGNLDDMKLTHRTSGPKNPQPVTITITCLSF